MRAQRTLLLALAATGSLGLLLGALAFQHLGGLAPCKMCLWQRWPHGVAVLIGVVALAAGRRTWACALPWLGMLATLSTAAVAGYHTGVERGWWAGPSSCTGGGSGDLLRLDGPLGVVMCDEVAWQMLGLSMASWNMLASLGLALLWAWAARR